MACGVRIILLYVTQLLTIINCLTLMSGNVAKTGALPLQVLRLISAFFFIATCLVFDHILLILSLTVFSVMASIVLLGLCSFYDFRPNIVELHMEIISAFFGWGAMVEEMFNYFKIKELSLTELAPEEGKEGSEKRKGGIEKILTIVSQNSMAISTLAAVAVAILTGWLIRARADVWSKREAMYVSFVGEIFLRVLKCLVLPLIFSSLLYAFANIDLSLSGRIACRTLSFYTFTTFSAIFLGIGMVLLIRPGVNPSENRDTSHVVVQPITTEDSILDLIRNLLPENFFQALVSYEITTLNCSANQTIIDCPIKLERHPGANILGVVMFAVIMGIVVSRVDGRVFMVEFFRGINDIFMEMTIMAINVMPFCVIFLIMPRIVTVGDLSVLFGSVGWYSMTVLTGLMTHIFVVLPFLYFIFVGKNPYLVYRCVAPALIMGFGTSSSSVTMPVTIKCLEERLGLDKRIVRFCIPIGTTVNMDGTALYEAVAAIFISQYREIPLTFPQLFVVALTATAASVGAAGIPQAGLVTMIIVLNAVNLPPQDAALIILVDWALDRVRTVCNILGDCYATSIVNHLSRNDFQDYDQKAVSEGKTFGTKDTDKNSKAIDDAKTLKTSLAKFFPGKKSKSTSLNKKPIGSTITNETTPTFPSTITLDHKKPPPNPDTKKTVVTSTIVDTKIDHKKANEKDQGKVVSSVTLSKKKEIKIDVKQEAKKK